jgi:hypothetical protein
MPRRSIAPLWLMGLTNAVFGMYGGIMIISVPQLLSARHVPEGTIAAMTAAMISPGFWTFLVSPVLDVRFSRRWYSVVTAALAAVLLMLALLNLDRLALVEVFLVAGYAWQGLAGSYAADACLSLCASVLLGGFLIWYLRRVKAYLAIASIRTGGNNCASCNHRAAYFRAAATNRAAQGEAVNVSLAAVAHDVPVILAFFLSPDLS